MITIKCCLVAIQTGQYSKLVFEDLNRDPCDDLKYVTVVMLPNWDYKDTLKIGDIGYLQFESVEAGKLSDMIEKYKILQFINLMLIIL